MNPQNNLKIFLMRYVYDTMNCHQYPTNAESSPGEFWLRSQTKIPSLHYKNLLKWKLNF